MTGAVGMGPAVPDHTQAYAVMVCAGAAVWLMAGRDESVRRARLLLAGGGELGERTARSPLPTGWLRRWLRKPGGPAAAVRGWAGDGAGHACWCLLAGVVLALLGGSWLPLAAGAAAVPIVARALRRRVRTQAVEKREAAVVELCAAVAGELRAGRPPDRALLSVGDIAVRGLGGDGSALLAAARFGGDVPGALRATARTPGAAGLTGAAACWQVSLDGGSGLADGLDRVATALRAERDQREDLRAQLAGPRSTATVLALLPAFGLLLGSAMGADPLRVLLHTPAGLGCLAVGVLLEWAGLAWSARLVRAAEGGGA